MSSHFCGRSGWHGCCQRSFRQECCRKAATAGLEAARALAAALAAALAVADQARTWARPRGSSGSTSRRYRVRNHRKDLARSRRSPMPSHPRTTPRSSTGRPCCRSFARQRHRLHRLDLRLRGQPEAGANTRCASQRTPPPRCPRQQQCHFARTLSCPHTLDRGRGCTPCCVDDRDGDGRGHRDDRWPAQT